MDGNKILVLDDVSVRYRKQDSRSTSDIVKRILGKPQEQREFWALKTVSFSLERGDMLGVIGKNGAGKSTMMKAISGTLTRPRERSRKPRQDLCSARAWHGL